jgi:hypothetical protein
MNQRDCDQLTLKREAIMRAPRPPDERRQLSAVLGVALGCMAVMVVVPAFIIAALGRPQPVISMSPASPFASATWARPLPGLVTATDLPLGTPLAPGARLPGALPDDQGEAWRGVAVSSGLHPIVAVWSPSRLFVSRDDGKAFHQVLGGPGEIGGAAIDAYGRLFMVRDRQRLGVQGLDLDTEWRSLPFAGETLQVAAGGVWLGWLALADDSRSDAQVVLALTADGGATWRTQSIADHATGALMRIEDDGTIHLLLVREDAVDPTMRRLRGHVDGRPMQEVPWPSSYAEAWGLGHGGFAYAIASECASEGNDICAMEVHGDLASTRIATAWSLQMGSNGATTLAASGPDLLRFDGRVATVVDRGAPAEITALAVDGLGRGVAIAGQHLVRWSPRHGWRVLFTQAGPGHEVSP